MFRFHTYTYPPLTPPLGGPFRLPFRNTQSRWYDDFYPNIFFFFASTNVVPNFTIIYTRFLNSGPFLRPPSFSVMVFLFERLSLPVSLFERRSIPRNSPSALPLSLWESPLLSFWTTLPYLRSPQGPLPLPHSLSEISSRNLLLPLSLGENTSGVFFL